MAKQQLSPCIFCGELPCACGGTQTKAKPVKKAPVFKVPDQPSAPVFHEAPTVDSTELFQSSKMDTFKTKIEDQASSHDLDELELSMAVYVLWPILHQSSKVEYAYLVDPELSADLFKRRGELRKVLQ